MLLFIRVLCAVLICVFLDFSPLVAAIGKSVDNTTGNAAGNKVSDKIKVSGKILEYGIVQSKEQLNYEIPGTAGENGIMVEKPEISETTTKIPMKKGTKFGYKWQMIGFVSDQPVEITYRYKHPPMIGLDGKRAEGFERSITVEPENGKIESFDGYEFSEDYELVPGNWTLSIVYQGKVIVTKTFQVVGGKK